MKYNGCFFLFNNYSVIVLLERKLLHSLFFKYFRQMAMASVNFCESANIKQPFFYYVERKNVPMRPFPDIPRDLPLPVNTHLMPDKCHFFRLNINRRKRRRIDFEGTACIQIEEASIDGKFVRLFNSGSRVSNSSQ